MLPENSFPIFHATLFDFFPTLLRVPANTAKKRFFTEPARKPLALHGDERQPGAKRRQEFHLGF